MATVKNQNNAHQLIDAAKEVLNYLVQKSNYTQQPASNIQKAIEQELRKPIQQKGNESERFVLVGHDARLLYEATLKGLDVMRQDYSKAQQRTRQESEQYIANANNLSETGKQTIRQEYLKNEFALPTGQRASVVIDRIDRIDQALKSFKENFELKPQLQQSTKKDQIVNASVGNENMEMHVGELKKDPTLQSKYNAKPIDTIIFNEEKTRILTMDNQKIQPHELVQYYKNEREKKGQVHETTLNKVIDHVVKNYSINDKPGNHYTQMILGSREYTAVSQANQETFRRQITNIIKIDQYAEAKTNWWSKLFPDQEKRLNRAFQWIQHSQHETLPQISQQLQSTVDKIVNTAASWQSQHKEDALKSLVSTTIHRLELKEMLAEAKLDHIIPKQEMTAKSHIGR